MTALLANSWSAALAGSTSQTETPENPPGSILLSSFYSFPQGSWMQVDWETALEVNVQGFNLYRRTSADEAWGQIYDQLIPAANPVGLPAVLPAGCAALILRSSKQNRN